MRHAIPPLLAVGASLALLAAAPSTTAELTAWFLHATSYDSAPSYVRTTKADYIGGNSLSMMPCKAWDKPQPVFNNFWQLWRYDRKHGIALAAGTTDQCSAAIFTAPMPSSVSVPDVDLSHYGTGRGLHIGSTYGDVLSTYGGAPVKHAGRFVLGYAATAYGHAVTTGHPLVKLPERITIVVQNDRVTAISIYIDAAALY